MPKRFGVSLSMSGLLSIRGGKSLKPSSRPARLTLATLGGFVLIGLWLTIVARAQDNAQASSPLEPCSTSSAIVARSHSITGTLHNHVITAASDPLCIKADLRVAKTLNTATPQVGDAITYTVTVTNGGPDDATGVQLTDVLPEKVIFRSATPQDVCTQENNTVTCDLGHLPNGDSAIVTTVVTPTQAGTITNVASVTSDATDPDPSNNTAEKTNRVTGADLMVTKTVNITAPKAGDVVTYTITVANNGPDNATGVRVTDTLPAGVTFGGYAATRGTYITATGLWNVGDLANAARATMTIAASVISCTGYPTMPNTASISAAWPNDPDPENNEAGALITPTSGVYCLYLPIIFKPIPLPCYTEDFSKISDDPNVDWLISPPPPGTIRQYVEDEYQIFSQTKQGVHWSRSPKGSFTDYEIQVEAHWNNGEYIGEEYGLIFDRSGGNDITAKMYRFNINTSNRTYVLGRLLNGKWEYEGLPSGSSLDIKSNPYDVNVLKVVRQGDRIELYINGKYQTHTEDNTLNNRPARVGLNVVPVRNVRDGDARFDNFRICSYQLGGLNMNGFELDLPGAIATTP